jgi:hypothetical protein
VLRHLHQFRGKPDELILAAPLKLSAVQFALAMEYGFTSWPRLMAAVEARTDQAANFGTARTRLYLLGYLREDSGNRELDASLTKAVERFQRDAGLAADGCLGPETVAALHDLAGFAGVPDLARWSAGDEETGLLRRAVGLRLAALGLLEKRTRCKMTIWGRLRDFARVAACLHLTDAPLKPSVSLETSEALETLAVLYDDDLLVGHLAAHEGSFTDGLSEEDAGLVGRFVAHAANIALWRRGYAVDPIVANVGVDGRVPMPLPGALESDADPAYAFYRALLRFWQDTDQDTAQAQRSARRGITPKLFAELVS